MQKARRDRAGLFCAWMNVIGAPFGAGPGMR